MKIKDKIKDITNQLLNDEDVQFIGVCEEAVDATVPNKSDHMISRMPTGRYSLIIDFSRSSQVAAFQKRKYR